MHSVVGILPRLEDAERAAAALEIAEDRVTVIAPEPRQAEDADVGRALGGVMGGAFGAAAGSSAGIGLASLVIPGVGPVIATGMAAGAVLGAVGVAIGMRAGRKADELNAGDPAHDPFDQFFYHDALRRGHAVVVALADSKEEANRLTVKLVRAGAKDVDAARESWWSAMREGERKAYEGDFARDEMEYQRGFQAAFEPAQRGQKLSEMVDVPLAYRKGHERGYEYFRKLYEAER